MKDSKRGIFASPRTIEHLISTYTIDPSFFHSVLRLSQLRARSDKHKVTDYILWERPLQPTFIELDYNTMPNKSEVPRLFGSQSVRNSMRWDIPQMLVGETKH
jgi:hypothetical protein